MNCQGWRPPCKPQVQMSPLYKIEMSPFSLMAEWGIGGRGPFGDERQGARAGACDPAGVGTGDAAAGGRAVGDRRAAGKAADFGLSPVRRPWSRLGTAGEAVEQSAGGRDGCVHGAGSAGAIRRLRSNLGGGRGGDVRGYCAVWGKKDRPAAPLPAVRSGHAGA
jgi:hypothetical protein